MLLWRHSPEQGTRSSRACSEGTIASCTRSGGASPECGAPEKRRRVSAAIGRAGREAGGAGVDPKMLIVTTAFRQRFSDRQKRNGVLLPTGHRLRAGGVRQVVCTEANVVRAIANVAEQLSKLLNVLREIEVCEVSFCATTRCADDASGEKKKCEEKKMKIAPSTWQAREAVEAMLNVAKSLWNKMAAVYSLLFGGRELVAQCCVFVQVYVAPKSECKFVCVGSPNHPTSLTDQANQIPTSRKQSFLCSLSQPPRPRAQVFARVGVQRRPPLELDCRWR